MGGRFCATVCAFVVTTKVIFTHGIWCKGRSQLQASKAAISSQMTPFQEFLFICLFACFLNGHSMLLDLVIIIITINHHHKQLYLPLET